MGRRERRAEGRPRRPSTARRYTGGRAAPARRRIRQIAFALVSLGFLTAAAVFLWPVLRPDSGATPGAVTIDVSMSGFSPSRIDARAGLPITLRFVNNDSQFHTDGGGWHQFAIDDLGVDVKIAPQSTQEVTITPESSGSYQFYCDVCCGGKENPYMVGTLAVGSPV